SDDEKKLKQYWPADVHIIGKEINRFHSLLWPAMLMSAGLEVPKKIAVHGWITVDGQKMSKTIGNVIDPFELVKKYPLDAVRYFFLREIPFDNDGDFSYERFEECYNSNLAHDLGNLMLRVTTLFEKTEQKEIAIKPFAVAESDPWYANYHDAIKAFRYHEALEFVWTLVREANKRLTDEKPWEALTDEKSKQCVGELLFRLYQIGRLLRPFLPDTAEKIIGQIEFVETSDALVHISSKKGKPLFPALEIKR
ncbi:MAG: class I tRNA ligase family protein, partial [Patescibacteria group bacterium]